MKTQFKITCDEIDFLVDLVAAFWRKKGSEIDDAKDILNITN